MSPDLGVSKGDATVHAPVALGGRYGIDPAVLAPTYVTIQASASTGIFGAAFNVAAGRGAGASNSVAVGAFFQGFGYGTNWPDFSTSNEISFGISTAAGLSIGITPPSQKHQPIG